MPAKAGIFSGRPVRPDLLKWTAGRQSPDDPHAIDVRLVIRRFDVFDVGPVFRIGVVGQCRFVSEAQEQEARFGFLDGNAQAAAGVGF